MTNTTQNIHQRRSKSSIHFSLIARWLTGCLVVFIVYSCNNRDRGDAKSHYTHPALIKDTARYLSQLDSLSKRLQTGDLIFRRGNDIASLTFAHMNKKDRRFSHVGIVNIEGGIPFVYHSLGGSFNPDQKIIREPVFSFASPLANLSVGAYHLIHINKPLISKLLDSVYRKGVPFDMDFDLNTDNRMYCSEMVYKILKKSSTGLNLLPSEIGRVKYVSTETFTNCPQSKEIAFIELK